MNPFPIYRCGFRPMSEVREWISSRKLVLDSHPAASKDFQIQLSDVLPGRISEGEATLHPKFFEILRLLRNAVPYRIHFTTNGSKLTKQFIDKLVKYKPLKVMISYHSSNPENWTKIFGLSKEEYAIATEAFQLLHNAGVTLVGAIVAMPNLVGYKDIEETMMFFNEYCQMIQLWKPAYSKYASDDIVKLLNHDEAEFTDFIHGMYKKCDKAYIRWDTDPDAPLDIPFQDMMIETVVSEFENVLWMTAKDNYARLKPLVEQHSKLFPNNHYVEKIISSYGGNVSCNGLMFVSDVNAALETTPYEYDAIVLSDKFLDCTGRDLTEVPWLDIRSYTPIIWGR